MRSVFLLGSVITSLLPAASTEALADHLATGFIAGSSPGHYWAMSSAYRATFDPSGVQLLRHGRRASIRFPGARLQWQAEGSDVAQVHFLGAERRSFAGAAALRARNAYPGVDIVVRLKEGRLKSEFQLAAGVSPSVAGYCLEGASVRAGVDGQSLRIDAGGGWQWAEEGLESWQNSPDGRRIPVRSRFRVTGRCVRFVVAKVDPSLPLTIDPELAFSSYLGGGMFDAITAIATDAQGNLYLGGWTESSDFPGLAGYQPASGGRIDGFVAKVNASGQLVFSTYLGGSGEDRVQAIVVDSAGVITVAGLTSSTNFPTLAAARGALAGGRDAFVTRLNPAGNQLVFSTYIGGTAHDAALALAIDRSGNIIVGGETASTNFPTLGAYSATSGGGVDGFLARFSPAGALLSSTYFGGGADDRIRGVAVGGDGVVHVTGSTASGNFPVAAAPFPSLRGSMDAFYTRFNSAASGISLSTYLGGGGGSPLSEEAGYGITIDTLGRAWIAGVTPSTDFPGVSSGNQTVYGGGAGDAFVSVFTAAGALEWSTYIGGAGLDAATSISAGSGFVGLAGYTTSNNLPVSGALQSARAGEYDAFWAAYPIASTAPLYISYLGGAGSDSALAAAASGSALAIGGSTLSANFPMQTPIQSSNPGSYGGFVSRLRFGPGPITVSPASGTGLTGTFTFNISHASGSAAIVNTAFLFNASYSFAGGCYVYYDHGANLISLYKDAGAVWLPLTPGAAATVDNGVCAISGTGLTVTSTANALSISLPVTFSAAFAGNKLVFANANDAAGLGAGWPQLGAWSVLPPSAPAVGTVTPASGTGLSQSFTVVFSDANGASDIASAGVLFNGVYSTANGCYFEWRRATNTILLFRDSDSAYLPVTPGNAAAVENANCSITGAGASVTVAGLQLTLTVPVTFKSAFVGAKSAYAFAADGGGLTSGWQSVGSWTPTPAYAPTVASVAPASGTALSQAFTAVFFDANGASDIATAGVLFNGLYSTANGCYFEWRRSTNTFVLFRDSDSAFLPLTPGTSATVENANCSITGVGASVVSSGSQLTMTVPVTFKAAFVGAKTSYAFAADGGGLTSGWQSVGSWTPTPAYAPTAASVAPASGGGQSQAFTAVFLDGNGYSDIVSAELLMNASLTTAGGCYARYDRPSNTAFLFLDSDATWLPLTPGAATSVSNEKCTLAGSGVTVSASGNALTLTFLITFRPEFSGAKATYLRASDTTGLSSGWVAAGTWSVNQPSPPSVTSISPATSSSSVQTFTIVLSDINGSSDISSALFLAGATLNGSNGCYISYQRSANIFYLFRDNDASWLPLSPGSAGNVSNANCTLTGATLTTVASGNSLTVTLPLSASSTFAGPKNFYVSVTDAGGATSNWVTAGSWNTAGAPPAAPAIGGVTPVSGSGPSQTFTVTLSDANGYADIASAGFLIHNAITAFGGCYLSYERAFNTIYLLRDADQSWLPLPLGSSASVQNDNCILSGAGLSLAGSGNTLTFKLPLTFKPAFAGAKNFYVLVGDTGNLTAGWLAAGSWNTSITPPAPPAISGVIPNAGSGTSQTFTVTLSDPNGHADIASAGFLIHSAISAFGGCYLSYERSANSIFLLRDADQTWLPLSLASTSSVENANCILSGAGELNRCAVGGQPRAIR